MNQFLKTLSVFILFLSAQFIALNQIAFAEKIKIISSLPRTGSTNGQTTSMVNSIKLALEEVNYQVAGMQISYEDWDDASPERGAWDPAVVAANADKAIKDQDIVAWIGPYNSGAAKIAMPKLNQAGLLMVSPGTTWPGLTKPGIGEANEPAVYRPSGNVTYFRVIPADDIQGKVAAFWAKDMGLKRAYVLHDRELYGQGIAQIFEKNAKSLGIQILGFEGIDPKAANYKSLVTKIRQQRPDLVYFGGTTQTNAGQIAKDLRGSGLNVKFMVPDGCFETSFIQGAGKENLEERAFITFGGLPPSSLEGAGKIFYQNYKNKYQIEPEAYAVYGYEAAKVVLEAIKRAGKKDRAAIIDAISKIKDYEGALGRWSFDANGDTSLTTMSGNTVRDGQFVFVKTLKTE